MWIKDYIFRRASTTAPFLPKPSYADAPIATSIHEEKSRSLDSSFRFPLHRTSHSPAQLSNSQPHHKHLQSKSPPPIPPQLLPPLQVPLDLLTRQPILHPRRATRAVPEALMPVLEHLLHMRALLRPEDDIRVHGLLLATDLFPEIGGLHPLGHGGTAARVGRGVRVGVRGDVVQVDVLTVGELWRGFGWGSEMSG